MGEIVATCIESKGSGPSNIKCPILTDTNYTVWTIRMEVLLQVHKVWETIDPGELKEDDKNNMAKVLLFQSIPESMVLQVGKLGSAKAVWDAIKTRYMGADRVKEARLQTLIADFNKIKMKDTDTMDSFVERLSELKSKSEALGEDIDEPKLVKKFLHSLPRKKYITIIAALEQVLDLNKTGFADIVGRIKAYEERIFEDDEEKQDDLSQNKLLFANSDSQQQSHQSQPQQERYDSNRGRGRGRFSNRGRGRGRYGNQQQGGYQQNGGYKQYIDVSKIVCYRCDKNGHYASTCPDRLLKLQETQENEADSFPGSLRG